MKLKEFIDKLNAIVEEHGTSIEVKMADGINVVTTVYFTDFLNEKVVVITDKTE